MRNVSAQKRNPYRTVPRFSTALNGSLAPTTLILNIKIVCTSIFYPNGPYVQDIAVTLWLVLGGALDQTPAKTRAASCRQCRTAQVHELENNLMSLELEAQFLGAAKKLGLGNRVQRRALH